MAVSFDDLPDAKPSVSVDGLFDDLPAVKQTVSSGDLDSLFSNLPAAGATSLNPEPRLVGMPESETFKPPRSAARVMARLTVPQDVVAAKDSLEPVLGGDPNYEAIKALRERAGANPITKAEVEHVLDESFIGLDPNDVDLGSGPVSGWLTALSKGATGLGAFMTSPRGLAEQLAALTPAKAVILAKWFYDMSKGAGESAGNLSVLLEKENKTPEDIQQMKEETVNTAMMLGGAFLAGKHGVGAAERFAVQYAPKGVGFGNEPLTKPLPVNQFQAVQDQFSLAAQRGMEAVKKHADIIPLTAAEAAKTVALEPTTKSGEISSKLVDEPARETVTESVTPESIAQETGLKFEGEWPEGKWGFSPVVEKGVPSVGTFYVDKGATPDAVTKAFKAKTEQFQKAESPSPSTEIPKESAPAGGEQKPSAMPTEIPKLRAGEKGTGELLQGEDAPFNLAGETAIDAGRLAKEKAEREAAVKENEAFQKKNQLELSEAKQSPAKASTEFDNLVKDWAVQMEWATDPNRLYIPGLEKQTSGLGTAGLAAKREYHKQLKIARRNAAKEIGVDPNTVETVAGRAAALQKLKSWIYEQERLNLPEPQGAIAMPGPPLSPATAPTPSLTPRSQRLIIQDLAKGLNIPIRFRRLTTSKFAGYFKKVANLVGSKTPNDIPIVAHEVGHKLDDSFSISKDKAIAAELDVLGDPATPGSRSSWTPSKSKSYKMGEGVAEFVRHWLTDPAAAIKSAPNTHAAFEAILAANKDMADVMRQAQGDIQTWRNAEPQARLRSHISVGENPNKTPYTVSQLTRDLVDDLHYLRLAVEHGEKGKGSALAPSKNPYLLARNLRGSYGMADTFIRSGEVDFKTKEVKLGTSLEDALKPVAGRLSDFRDWIVAKRAQELHKQGRETGLVDSDVQYTAKKFDADPVFQKAFDDVKAWNDSLLQYSVDSGLITKESAEAMRRMNDDYVPFHRVFEVGAGEMPSQQSSGIGMGLNVGKPGSMKRLHGSSRDIVDPLETMVKNAYVIVTASEKAAINRAVAEMSNLPDMGRWVERVAAPKERVQLELERIREQLEKAGADVSMLPDDFLLSFFKPSGKAPFGENIIRVVRDGEPQFYRLQRDLHDTFQALDLEDTGKLIRIMSAPAQLLRAGVVLEPSFALANAMRDTFSSAVIGKYGALPFETTARGVGAMINNPKLVAEWAASGGRSAVEASYFDRAKLQKFLAERISKDLTPAERALVITKSPLTALRWLTSVAEEATRIGEYQKAYNSLTKSGMPASEARRLAAFEARDRQDFAKGGAKTKIIRHMAAFWNAQLQANVKLAQSFKRRPIRTTLQGLAFITTAKLLEQAINWNDEDYWDRPQWERDLFFLIPAGKDDIGHARFIRIPTPFEVGLIFGTLPGRMLQWAKEKRPESMKDFPALMLKQSIPNPIPQSLQMVFEDFLSGDQGWDVWRGRPIVPDSLADLPPELQWTEQTSRLAKEVGGRLGMSPMKIDHIIDQTSGGMGKILTGRQVPGKRFVTTPLAQSNEAVTEFYDILDSLRKQRAAVKATDKGDIPGALTAFEHASKKFSKLRDRAREEKTEVKKLELQNQIFQEAKELVEKYKSDPESVSALRVDPKTGAVKSGSRTIYAPEK